MKRWIGFLLCILIALATTGCATSAPTTPPPTSAPAASPASRGIVTASVKVVPAQIANLSFIVSGPVKDISVKEGQAVLAGQTLVTLDVPDLSFGETAAAAALKSAQDDAFIQSQGRRKWNGFKFVWVSGPPEQLGAANAKVLQTQAGLALAQAQLAQATLLAPFDGTVVSIAVSRGEMVQPQQEVATIGSVQHLQVETTDLSERVIAGVRIGQTASVRLKAFDAPLAGRVIAIAPLAGKSEDGDTVFKVTIELNQHPAGLMWGMTGDVDISMK